MTEPVRVLALATHPIQYHSPWYQALAARGELDFQVLYEYLPDDRAQGRGFGQTFQWDVPLLDGYTWHTGAARDGTRARGAAVLALHRLLARFSPQVVLLTGWHSALLLAAPGMARRAGARLLVRGESNVMKPRPRWVHAAHRRLLRRYDGFLAVGSANRAFYAQHGVPAERIVDCRYFVDNDRFERQAREALVHRGAIRARFAVPAGATCFVFAGKLEAKKRVLDAIRAVAQVPGRSAHLLVVGSGPLEREARRLAAGLPVSFAGFLNQAGIAEAYAAGDCLLLPSDAGETWGLVVNEAMACSRPAIVSDRVGCAADLVLPGRTGWIVPLGDVPALANAMARAAADPQGLVRMGAAAHRHVTHGYTVEGAAAATVRTAQRLRGGPLRTESGAR